MIIGIAGKQRAGKDSLAARLIEVYGGTSVPFAKALKEMAAQLWGEREKGALTRHLLQGFGQGIRELDPDCWLRAWFREVLREGGPEVLTSREDHVFVPDVRYPNERSLIHTLTGLVIRLDVGVAAQRQRGAQLDNAAVTHASETALDDDPWFDLRLDADRPADAVLKDAVRCLDSKYLVRLERQNARRDPEAARFFKEKPGVEWVFDQTA